MHIMEQQSPMLFDLDSPYMQRIRKMSSTIKDTSETIAFDMIQKSSEGLKSSLKVPSIRLQRIGSKQEKCKQIKKEQTIYERSNMLRSEQKIRKVVFSRQRSQPLQISHQNKNVHVESSSNNENVRKRMTSLQKYFEQTRSIQLPFATKNRINQNERFLSQIKEFQMNLSRAKSVHNGSQYNSLNTSRKYVQGKGHSRLAQTRPKPLKIHQLQSENVKKEKNRILVQRIMKQKVKQYRQSMFNQDFNEKEESIFALPIPLDSQINSLGNQVQKLRLQLNFLKRQTKQKTQKLRLISDYFAFLQ